MPLDLSPEDRAAINQIVTQLETAWNAADGPGFAERFADDADFVNIRGDHARGKNAIAAGHTHIFQTIYARSRNQFTVESARLIHPDVAIVHTRAALEAPQGPLAGKHNSRFSMVLTKSAGTWQIASFHNTLQAGPPPGR